MSMTKRVVSIVLALLMVFSAMSCLGTVASATYTSRPTSDWVDIWNRSFDSTETYQLKSMDELVSYYGNTPFIYEAVVFFEEDPEFEWECPGEGEPGYMGYIEEWKPLESYYVHPGQKLRAYIFIKSNYALGSIKQDFYFDRRAMKIDWAAAGVSKYSPKYTLASDVSTTGPVQITGYQGKDGLYNDYPGLTTYTGYNTDSAFIVNEVDGAAVNGTFGLGGGKINRTTNYKTRSNSNLAQDVLDRLDWARINYATDPAYETCAYSFLDVDEDGYTAGDDGDMWFAYIPFVIREGSEPLFAGVTNDPDSPVYGLTADDYHYVDVGTDIHFGIDYYLTSQYKPAKFASLNTIQVAPSGLSSASQDTVKAYYQISGLQFDYDDCNYTFQIAPEGDFYTVSFADTGDSVCAAIAVTAGESCTLPTPVCDGYAFEGWDEDDDGVADYAAGDSYTPEENITLKGIWTAVQSGYTLTFDCGVASMEGVEGAINLPAAPAAPAGKVFKGWSDGTNTYNAGARYTVTGNVNFTAVFADVYTATFVDSNGNEVITTAQYEAGATITFPTVNAREGFTGAWTPAGVTTMPAADTTFTYVWTAGRYTITFDSDDGSAVAPITDDYNASIAKPADPTKTGYEFGGWQINGSDVTWPYNLKSNVTMTAKWNAKTYDAVFMISGVSTPFATIPVQFGSAFTAPALPTETGYTFSAWSPASFVMDAEGKTYTTTKSPNQYLLTFNDKDGGYISSYTATFGNSVVFPTAPVVTGSTFLGWDDGTNVITNLDNVAVPAAATTYTAKYSDVNVTIKFYLDNVQVGADVPTAPGATIEYPTAADLGINPLQKTWSGWGSDAPAVIPNDAEDGAVYSFYSTSEFINYTINYIDGDDSVLDTKTAHYGDPIPAISAGKTATKEGYEFGGWLVESDATVTGNLNIEADWTVEEYCIPVVYGLDGSGDGEVFVTYGQTFTEAEFIELCSDNDFNISVTGYNISWDGISFPYTVPDLGDMSEVADPVTVVYNGIDYTITYKWASDESIIASNTVPCGDTIPAAPAATKTGYDVTKWYANAACTGGFVTIPEKMPARNIVLYAKAEKHLYTDKWFDIGADVENDEPLYTATVLYGDPVPTQVIPERAGYTDLKWAPTVPATQPAEDKVFVLSANAGTANYKVTTVVEDYAGETTSSFVIREGTTGETVSATTADKTKEGYVVSTADSTLSGTVAANGSLELTVYFKPDTYTITWKDSSWAAEGDNVDSYMFGAPVTIPDITAKTGYTAGTWSYSTALGENNAMPARNVVATASYTINSYNVIFVIVGNDTPAYTKSTVYQGEIKSWAAPDKSGYLFDGWYADSECTGDKYTFGGAMPAEDVTVYGKYDIQSYTIIYKNADGTEFKKETYEYGAPIDTLETKPTKEGYTFSNWSITIPATMPAKNLVAEPVFTVNQYDVVYMVDGVQWKNTVKTNYGEAPVPPVNPSKTGYRFTGWTYEPALNDGKIGAANVTATAQFAIQSYNAVFFKVAGDAEAYDTKNTVFDADIVMPEEPTRANYNFLGWKKEGADDSTAAKTGLKMDAEGVTFVGVWQKDNNASFIESVTNNDAATYYSKASAKYTIVVKGEADAVCIENGASTMYYSKATFQAIDGGVETVDPLSGVYSITKSGDKETWVVENTLAAGTYNAYAVMANGDSDKDNPFEFTVTFATKTGEVLSADINSLDLNFPNDAETPVTQIVKGTDLIWTVKTSTDVTWLKFVGKYTLEDNTVKTLTTIYKYGNTSDRVSITDEAGVRTWVLTMKFTYSADQDTISESWVMSYKVDGVSTYFDYNSASPIEFTVGKNADVFKDDPVIGGETYDKYSIISVTPKSTNVPLNSYEEDALVIKTTDDVTKLRITVAGKAATYQATSTNVKGHVDNEDGTITWTIKYKYSVAGSNEYKVESRGTEWGSAHTFNVTVGE